MQKVRVLTGQYGATPIKDIVFKLEAPFKIGKKRWLYYSMR